MSAKEPVTIYHNPRCSKSRATLAILRQRGIEPNIVDYLKTPPTIRELQEMLRKLGMKPEQLARKAEELYKARFAGKVLDDEQWLEALSANPILMERPIVIRGERAIIGRPPEKVEDLL